MNTSFYARKKRHIQNLAKQLEQELSSTSVEISNRANTLITKIKSLLSEVRYYVGKYELGKMLGTVAVLFGICSVQEVKAQQFTSPIKAPFGIGIINDFSYPALADLDGDIDLLVTEYNDSILYFQNRAIHVSLIETDLITAKLFPNPTTDFVEINATKEFSFIEIYNVSGQLVKRANYHGNRIAVKELPHGVYSLKVYDDKKQPLTIRFTKS